MLTENFSYLTLRDAVKFVVGDKGDLVRAEEIINGYGLTGTLPLVSISTSTPDMPSSSIRNAISALRTDAACISARCSEK